MYHYCPYDLINLIGAGQQFCVYGKFHSKRNSRKISGALQVKRLVKGKKAKKKVINQWRDLRCFYLLHLKQLPIYHNAETRQMRRILAEKRNIKGLAEKVPNSG